MDLRRLSLDYLPAFSTPHVLVTTLIPHQSILSTPTRAERPIHAGTLHDSKPGGIARVELTCATHVSKRYTPYMGGHEPESQATP
jgi:hypothetical protein